MDNTTGSYIGLKRKNWKVGGATVGKRARCLLIDFTQNCRSFLLEYLPLRIRAAFLAHSQIFWFDEKV